MDLAREMFGLSNRPMNCQSFFFFLDSLPVIPGWGAWSQKTQHPTYGFLIIPSVILCAFTDKEVVYKISFSAFYYGYISKHN